MIAVLFAEGFEEIEALAPVNLLRRAGARVCMVGVWEGGAPADRRVTGSHGIPVLMDAAVEELDPAALEAVILPGGLPGTTNLEKSPAVQSLIDACAAEGKLIGAICAAPSILAHKGLLQGREAISFPGFHGDLEAGGARRSEAYVVRDGQFVTARGMGVAVPFGLKLVEILVSPEKAAEIGASIQLEKKG